MPAPIMPNWPLPSIMERKMSPPAGTSMRMVSTDRPRAPFSLAVRKRENHTMRIHVLREKERLEQCRIKAGPLEAILVIFGCRALFFYLKAIGKIWKMTPLLCACAVVITLETQKCRKWAPRYVEFNFFINCDRQKRFPQNERIRADLQNMLPQIFYFCPGT